MVNCRSKLQPESEDWLERESHLFSLSIHEVLFLPLRLVQLGKFLVMQQNFQLLGKNTFSHPGEKKNNENVVKADERQKSNGNHRSFNLYNCSTFASKLAMALPILSSSDITELNTSRDNTFVGLLWKSRNAFPLLPVVSSTSRMPFICYIEYPRNNMKSFATNLVKPRRFPQRLSRCPSDTLADPTLAAPRTLIRTRSAGTWFLSYFYLQQSGTTCVIFYLSLLK